MESRRLKLHERLVEILGTNHVYFQPPENIKLEYPSIVYSRKQISNRFADNLVYKQNFTYQIIVIDYDPDSAITAKLSTIPNCEYRNSYESDGLNHDVFNYYI